jgi:hypothetical protein
MHSGMHMAKHSLQTGCPMPSATINQLKATMSYGFPAEPRMVWGCFEDTSGAY